LGEDIDPRHDRHDETEFRRNGRRIEAGRGLAGIGREIGGRVVRSEFEAIDAHAGDQRRAPVAKREREFVL
jgi:hypothetical protein